MGRRTAIATVLLTGALSLASPDRARARAKDATAPSVAPDATVQTVIVTAKAHDAIGTAFSASAGVVGGVELSERPLLRQGELLEAVPGMIVTAHTGGGKANQYYLRGFNLDHGTDFATFVDGAPVNLGTHAHGQGYMDLNWLIPELVAGITFRKGNYYADVGDFAAAGSAEIAYLSELPTQTAVLEGGTDDYERVLLAGSARLGPGTLLYAGEYLHYDGPFTKAADYRRPNGLLKYTVGDAQTGGGLTAQLYEATWSGSDQLPVRALATLAGGRYGTLDPFAGGQTHRYSLSGEWHWGEGNVTRQVSVYAFQYGLNLFSDFTYFIDPANGDEIRQYESRAVVGGQAKTTIVGDYLGRRTVDTFGAQSRNDFVNVELDRTVQRRLLDKVRSDQAVINSAALYWDNTITWTPWLQTDVGLRLDAYHFDLESDARANSGETTAVRPEPKIGVTLTPWRNLDVYGQAGISERSNDARGIFDTVPAGAFGATPSGRSRPLVRSIGYEVGARARMIPGLTSTLAVWYLESNSELFFSGDTGADEDTDRPGHRYGVEFNTIYKPTRWLTLDGDLSISQAFFTDHDTVVGNQIPEAIRSSASGSATIHDMPGLRGLTASLRGRYFGPRNLIENGGQQSKPVTVFNARVTYDLTPRVTLGLEVPNLLDAHYNDAEYFDVSRLKGEPANPLSSDGSYLDHETHAGEPREFRLGVTLRY